MLKDTLVVWGRRIRPHGVLAGDADRAITTAAIIIPAASACGWLAAACKGGVTHGETDEFSYNIVKDPVDVHDLHATMLHCLGVDHTRLTYKFQGRHFRLTDVKGNVVKAILG